MEEMMQVLPVALAVLVLLAAAATYLRSSSRHCAGNTRRTVPVPATIEVRDPEAARRMIIDHADSFSEHPAVPFPVDLDAGHPKTTSINSAPYGPLWRVLRCNLTAGVLHPSRLAHLAPLQRDAVEALVADLAAGGRGGEGDEVVAVRDALYTSVFKVVVCTCFGDHGVGERDVRAMQRTLHMFFHSGVDARRLATSKLARLLHWRQWRYLVGTRGRLAEVFVPAISARRRLQRSDGGGVRSYVDSLLDLRVPDDDDGEPSSGGSARRRSLRDDEMVRLVWEFLGAGTETVVACVEWTLALLVAHPEVQEKLHRELSGGSGDQPVPSEERLQDMPYLRAVILESLRLHPPVPFILRYVVVGLPEGAAAAAAGRPVPLPRPNCAPVHFMFMAEDIGRDPKAWTDPEEFRPERFLDGGEGEDVLPVPGTKEVRMMPFGAGRRSCPGSGLAMIQAKCFVGALVREFEWAPPANGCGVDLTSINALFLKVMASPLRARIVPRRSLVVDVESCD